MLCDTLWDCVRRCAKWSGLLSSASAFRYPEVFNCQRSFRSNFNTFEIAISGALSTRSDKPPKLIRLSNPSHSLAVGEIEGSALTHALVVLPQSHKVFKLDFYRQMFRHCLGPLGENVAPPRADGISISPCLPIMLKGFLSVLAILSAVAVSLGAALPVESDAPELRCPVATDCPIGYTCCGLYDVKLGGYCKKLESGQYCIM